jgi:hypothetical protein
MMYAFTIFKLQVTKLRYHVMCLYVNQVYVSGVRKQPTQ